MFARERTAAILSVEDKLASDSECLRQLDSMLYRTSESARLNAVAIQHGFNIHSGQIETVDKTPEKFVAAYMQISINHADAVEKMKSEFEKNCIR